MPSRNVKITIIGNNAFNQYFYKKKKTREFNYET